MSDPSSEPTASQYEFTPAENEVVRDLAGTLSVTGLVLIALAIVAILYAGVFIAGSRQDPTPLVVTALCAPMVIAGFGLRSAAEPLLKIVHTKGEDVTHLMSALREFKRVFALQRLGFALALMVAVAGVLVQAMH
ncbi:MAG: hypothetical protein IPN17_34965 [Deltaproteobacteria bacterium]|nr:hypothetical protein [Deltaproteobacteria bacterium]MBK8697324.1 hypothetical protein [Deltaproteobacteria bacterium]MBP6830383.1 hypothetical protein [Deltaproteobacteria bacterium]